MMREMAEQYLADPQETSSVWEVFHENSKTSRFERHQTFAFHPSDTAIVAVMNRLRRYKPYRDFPKVALPREVPASERTLDDVLESRETARSFTQGAIPLNSLAKILFLSYGVTRDNVGTTFPRPFRVVPSGGALYPLELYLMATAVDGLEPGLYHYDPEHHVLTVLNSETGLEKISPFFVQTELVKNASAILFVTAIFFRSTFKYGDRGYRFVLLEAGHLAQNAILTASDLGLAAAPVGGFLDRDVDEFLGVDGVNESTVYTLLFGLP
jgi:SagB-type dehydrogenase family enzyme